MHDCLSHFISLRSRFRACMTCVHVCVCDLFESSRARRRLNLHRPSRPPSSLRTTESPPPRPRLLAETSFPSSGISVAENGDYYLASERAFYRGLTRILRIRRVHLGATVTRLVDHLFFPGSPVSPTPSHFVPLCTLPTVRSRTHRRSLAYRTVLFI